MPPEHLIKHKCREPYSNSVTLQRHNKSHYDMAMLDQTIILNELVAHRGASEHAPENTLAAFELAKEQGAKWLEFDVSTMGDGTPIIMHDATTSRCSDQDYAIEQLNRDILKTIDAGSWFSSAFVGETIPLFTEVLEWLRNNNMYANIEIKRHPQQCDTVAFVQPILDCLINYRDLWPRLLITSFDPVSLDYCKAHEPNLLLGALFDQLPDDWQARCTRWQTKTIHINYKHLSQMFLTQAQENGMIVRSYTPPSYHAIAHYLGQGLTSVIVNSPLLFMQAIKHNSADANH